MIGKDKGKGGRMRKILKVILKAGTGLYPDDYEVFGEYEVLDEQEFYKNLENIKRDLKEHIEEEKGLMTTIGALYKFPCDVNEIILYLNGNEIARIPVEWEGEVGA